MSAANQPTEELVSNADGDDVNYHFGGAAICAMLKCRYKDIRKCSAGTRDSLSIEICFVSSNEDKG